MWHPYKYFLDFAIDVVNKEGVRYNKVTSGYAKGEYNIRLDIPKSIKWEDQDEYLIEKYGEKIPTNGRMSNSDKEQAKRYLINEIAGALQIYNKTKSKQPLVDKWNYYNNTKDETDYYKLTGIKDDKYSYAEDSWKNSIGKDVLDYFRVIDGTINDDNWKGYKYEGKGITGIGKATNFKELYYVLKTNAKESYSDENTKLNRNRSWNDRTIETYVFDEENIPEIKAFEQSLEVPQAEIKITETKPIKPDIDQTKNTGHIKVGYRSEFLKTPILYGRERVLILANGEKHKCQYAIIDLENILASHNEYTFTNTENYPVNVRGENINDRNYAQDKNAQAKVAEVAQNFEPEVQVSTSATASGLPVITIDGVVVSGNNRTMSLKRMVKEYPENYDEYKKVLSAEILSFGFDSLVGTAILMNDSIALPGSSFHNPLSIKFKTPVLIRIDYDFPAYTTTEMNKYNKETKKSERPIDRAIKLSSMLLDNEMCFNRIAEVVNSYEILSDLYTTPNDIARLKTIFLSQGCALLTLQEIPAYFTENNTLTANGKEFLLNLLAGMILDKDSLLSSEMEGVKRLKEKIVTALPLLIKNARFKEGSIIEEVNKAVLLQQKLVSSKLSNIQYSSSIEMFNEIRTDFSFQAYMINAMLTGTKFVFKKFLESYNNSLEESQGNSLFGDKMTPEQIFDEYAKKFVDADIYERLKSNVSKGLKTKGEGIEKAKAKAMAIAKIKIMKLKNKNK